MNVTSKGSRNCFNPGNYSGTCKKPENTTDSNCSEVSDLRETPGAPGVLKQVDQQISEDFDTFVCWAN